MAERELISTVQVSHDSRAGEAAEVQGVVRVAPDGSHVYFVARGVLGEGPNAQGRLPLAGADNLYVYDVASGRVSFISDVCSGAVLSGTVEDVACPASLDNNAVNDTAMWLTPNEGEAQTGGGDGRFLVFSSYGQLTRDDTDTAKDVYRYDAVTGELGRVSVGEVGNHANGNDSAFDARIEPGHRGGSVSAQHEMDKRAVSEDGSRVVFSTAEPLSPDAVNGLTDAYEWHEGGVSLISSGSAEEADRYVVISPPGRDVFFTTVQSLVPQDSDDAVDVYDARIGGGFPVASAPRQPCSGDACQGPLTNPAPLLVPGSLLQAPGEGPAAGKKATLRKLTPAQQLARALRVCAKQPRGKRAACWRGARRKHARTVGAGRGQR